ncbi:uncharacterized protein SCHCODRAFT_02614006 [Schizophyllum commune H4-8]|nr:uncharacterized protein SCHCODRAFT_02614006 [Schizophyllum commune H4-8]KAI5896085.1 hypothetical protein SCHCODRAFT_02614006 [Schizophyllum commune H4-8]
MSTADNSERAAKRQRTEDPPELSAAKRHGKHWCRDGSVVLHVEDTLFRVHQSTLERLSEAFKDLFTVPPPEGEALLDGCPLVRLEGDSSADWETLLDAIYDPIYFVTLEVDIHNSVDTSIPTTLRLLRLATKYRIIAFRKTCINLLSVDFHSDRLFKVRDPPPPPQNIVLVMIVAHETNALTLLPCAYLLCVTELDENEIFTDVTLPAVLKVNLYHGILGILDALRKDVFPYAHGLAVVENCERFVKCSISALFQPYFHNPHSPCYIFADNLDSREACRTICDVCYKRVSTTFYEGRQKTWERLPEIFGLGKDWDELRRIQDYDSTPDP